MKMKLIFASRNCDKIAELRAALAGLPLEISSAADFPDLPEVAETGATLEENAFLKARAIHVRTGGICLADDTGLEVDALDGAPGVRSARFGGAEQSYERNLKKLLEAMEAVPAAARTARFRTSVAIIFPDGTEALAEGICAGTILAERRGAGGFGYDPVFFIPEVGMTFAEMSLAEKQGISHRGRAMRRARQLLEARLTGSA